MDVHLLVYSLLVEWTDVHRFMDAEIGVRNLADSFRYNVLPDIVAALGLADGKIGVIAESFEDLPEYERLSMLVGLRVQTSEKTFSNPIVLCLYRVNHGANANFPVVKSTE